MVDIGALFQGGMAGFDRGMEFRSLQLKQEEAVRKKKAEARKAKKENFEFYRTLDSALTIGFEDSFGENATIDPEGFFGPKWVQLRVDALTDIITANNPNGEPLTPSQKAFIKMLAGQTASRLKGLTRVLRQAGTKGVNLKKALRLSHDDPELFNKLFGTLITNALDRAKKRQEAQSLIEPLDAADPSEDVADPGEYPFPVEGLLPGQTKTKRLEDPESRYKPGAVKRLDLPTAVQTPAPAIVPVDAGADAGASKSGLVPTPILDKRIVELDKQIATLAQTLKEGYARGASQTDMFGPQKRYADLVGLRKDIVAQRDKRKDQGLKVEKQELEEDEFGLKKDKLDLEREKFDLDKKIRTGSPTQRVQTKINVFEARKDAGEILSQTDERTLASLRQEKAKLTQLAPPHQLSVVATKLGERWSENFNTIMENGRRAQETVGNTQILRALLESNRFETGSFAHLRLALKQLGELLLPDDQKGIFTELMGKDGGAMVGETIKAVGNFLVTRAYENAAGGQINKIEAQVIEGSFTKLTLTPDGNSLLVEIIENRALHNMKEAAHANGLVLEGKLDLTTPKGQAGFRRDMAKWRIDNPFFDQGLKDRLAALPDRATEIPNHVAEEFGITDVSKQCSFIGIKRKGEDIGLEKWMRARGEEPDFEYPEGSSILLCNGLRKQGQTTGKRGFLAIPQAAYDYPMIK